MTDTSKVHDFQEKLRSFGWKDVGSNRLAHKSKAGQELRIHFKGSEVFLEVKNEGSDKWDRSHPTHITNIRIQDDGRIYWENHFFMNPPKTGQDDYQSVSKIVYKHLKSH